MRFLADENISKVAMSALRALGHEVISIAHTQLGAPDSDVLKIADQLGLILITEDQDFGELVIRHGLPVLGVILMELDALSNTASAKRLCATVTQIGSDLAGNLVVIEPARTRIRPLRIGLTRDLEGNDG